MPIAVFYSLYIFYMNTRELYKEVTSKVLKVYEIFQDYFGEDKVDLQGLKTEEQTVEYLGENECEESVVRSYLSTSSIYIYVHFPEVRVTNEHDKYVDIKHLWAKVGIMIDGRLTIKFTLNRSEYSLDHLAADYMHSHLGGVNWGDPSIFMEPCTGSGPINRTMASLFTEYDESLWLLFCCELGMYVTVESLAGVPYRRLEQIGVGDPRRGSNIPESDNPIMRKFGLSLVNYRLFSDFYRYFINKKCLRFTFCNDGYYLGISFLEFRILLSNHFIEWINRTDNPYRFYCNYPRLLSRGILKKYIIKDNKLYTFRDRTIGGYHTEEALRAHFENRRVLTFKGEEIRTVIISNDQNQSENYTLLLEKSVCDNFLSLILRTINYEYGTASSDESSTDSQRKTRYI